MRIADTSVPVVVLKPDHHGALGIFRSLGRLGVKVYGVGTQGWSAGMSSRYCREKFIFAANGELGEELVGFLHNVARKIGRRSILTCANDVSRVFIAKYADALKDGFILPAGSLRLVESLSDKKQMYLLCKQHGISTAETAFPQSRAELKTYIEGGKITFPVMLKGIDGFLLERSGKSKMVIVRNPKELLENYDQMETPERPNLMLQEYIPGGDDSVWMFNGYFNRQSECLLGFAGKKIRQYPIHTGSTSLGICLRNESVEHTTRSFMKSVGYQGVLDIGYRYDARDGRYCLLDVNPRIGATFRLWVDENGMDVVRAMYLDSTGQPVPVGPIREGRKWLVENNDLISFRRYRAQGTLTVRDWLRSLHGVREVAWFAWDDPLPFALMGARLVGQLAQFIWRKLRRAARPEQLAAAGPSQTALSPPEPVLAEASRPATPTAP